MTNAAAWLREFSAHASGCYLRLKPSLSGEPPQLTDVQAGPTWLLSDMNAAPGKTATTGTSALFTLVAY